MSKIKIRVQFPETKEGKQLLQDRIAEQHAKIIKNYINKLSWTPEKKLQLWDEILASLE